MKKLMFVFLLMFSVSIFAQKIQNKLVDAACGMCQFKVKSEKGCAVFVRIDGNLYPVEGIDKKVFGDAHADDGYCKMIKKAYVSGEIRKGKFYATAFKYQES
jgi:hypothetical protein